MLLELGQPLFLRNICVASPSKWQKYDLDKLCPKILPYCLFKVQYILIIDFLKNSV